MLYAWISHSYSHVFKYLHLLCVFIWIFGLVWFGFFFKIADFPLIKSRLLKIVFVVCFNGTLCFSDCFKMFMDFYIQSSIFMQGEILRIFFSWFWYANHSSFLRNELFKSWYKNYNFRQHSSAVLFKPCLSLPCLFRVDPGSFGTSLLGWNHSVCEQLHLPDVTYNCKSLAERMSVTDTTSFDWRNVATKWIIILQPLPHKICFQNSFLAKRNNSGAV